MEAGDLKSLETNPRLEGYDPETKESTFNLGKAKWIWLPSQRTLPNTFIFFRKEFDLDEVPKSAKGWIGADSRYALYVNGHLVQVGPAPHDPRHAEADPLEIAKYLRKGKNCIGVHVLFYGQGDGTWPTGKPGLIFHAQVGKVAISTDKTWHCSVDRSHQPGGYKRWYLRALQEIVDLQGFVTSWSTSQFQMNAHWYKAQELSVGSDHSAFANSYSAYNEDTYYLYPERASLRPRSIPMMIDEWIPAKLYKIQGIQWHGNPNDWFEFRVPGTYTITDTWEGQSAEPMISFADSGRDFLLTYELPHNCLGYPEISARTNGNAEIEMMFQESLPKELGLLDTQFHSWLRIKPEQGTVHYRAFEYECCKYIQVHAHFGPKGLSEIPTVGINQRRLFARETSRIKTSEPELNELLQACHNTLLNSCQDIVVDGMARERQQYGGDGAVQLNVARVAHGMTSISKRYLTQFGYGQMKSGIWFDSWPAYDRYARLAQRQIDATGWGSIVDHSIGFVIEHANHWMQTGDKTPYEDHAKQIEKFEDYLITITGLDGLLKVDDIGTETVWIDHDAYTDHSHKKLALNLYHLQMRVMLGWLRGQEPDLTFQIEALRKQFWSPARKCFVNNLWEATEKGARYCDRSIYHLLWLHAHGYEVAPEIEKTVEILGQPSKQMGQSYPVNSCYRHWAWARIGRIDLVIKELREVWAKMYSVKTVGTIQEMWNPTPGTTSLMSHCGVVPTLSMVTAILGLGYDRNGIPFIRPQLGDLEMLEAEVQTPKGLVHFEVRRKNGYHELGVTKPTKMPLWAEIFSEDGQIRREDLSLLKEFSMKVLPLPSNQLLNERPLE